MKTRKIIASTLIGYMGVWAFPEMIGNTTDSLYLTNSVFSVLLWIVAGLVVYRIINVVDWKDTRANVLASILAFAFSLCMALGAALDSADYFVYGDLKRIAGVILFSAFIMVVIRGSWGYLDKSYKKSNVIEEKYSKKQIVMIFLILIICWIPVLLASYPGFFVYDAQDEVNEVLTRNFTTHHPLLHVLALGGTVALVHKITGSFNLGIMAYTVAQMITVAGCFTYMMCFLRRHHVHKWFRTVSLFFMGLFPVIPMYALCSTKDTLFSAALLVMIITIYDMLACPDKFFSSWKSSVVLGLSTFIMMSLRHNGFYAFLVLIPVLLLRVYLGKDFRDKKYGNKVLIIVLVTIALYFVSNKVMVLALHADTSENQEMLTVPIMQLTRVHEISRESFSEEELDTLYKYLPREAMARYNEKLSDAVKMDFNNEYYKKNKGEFWRLWLDTGLKNPGAYINAWLYTSYGFWYPDTVIDVYGGIQRYTFQYDESSYFGYETELPGVRESKLPWLDEIYRKMSLEIYQQKIPVLSMLFSPGFMFWLYAYAFAFFWKNRQYDRLLQFGIVVLLWLTVLLGPTYMVRYVLIFWFALPVLLAMLFEKYSHFK